jgi:hypothetical protein
MLKAFEHVTIEHSNTETKLKKAVDELKADLEAEKSARRGFQERAAALTVDKKLMVKYRLSFYQTISDYIIGSVAICIGLGRCGRRRLSGKVL